MEQLRAILRQYWGYDDFRPLQAEAMRAVVEGRDSLVVLPTGGGKSLCFQAPALAMPGLAVVVSPLISLMKDQVDALVDCGVPAACVNSTLTAAEKRADRRRDSRRAAEAALSLARAAADGADARLPAAGAAVVHRHRRGPLHQRVGPRLPARVPRAAACSRSAFPNVALHAYTATATPHVRDDIVRELGLREPEVLVGSFDRPNLDLPRPPPQRPAASRSAKSIDRHPDEPGIIYCIRRTDVEEIAAQLASLGYQALPYHAGMSDDDRRRNQDAFINDRAGSSSPRSPSAWASTSRTCAT